MAVITLKVVVGNLESVRRTFNQIKIYRSTTGLTGNYTELTDSTTRIYLEAGKTVYDYIDEAGAVGYYYKSSYYETVSGLESSLSDAQQGEGDTALDIVSVSELKTNYLFGLDLTIDDGTPFPDSLYQWFIQSAVSWVEHRLDIPIRPKPVEDERHDYYREDYEKYIWLHLKEYPVIDVEEVKMVLPGEEVIQTFDRSWLHVQKDSGQVNIVPGSGTAGTIIFGASGTWVPFLYGRNRFIPDVFRVKYTAGFASNEVPPILRDIIGKVASFGPLNIAGDLIGGAGIASSSLSLDGLSQSINTTSSATNAGYGARLIQYQREIKDVIPTLTRYYKGPRMTVA